MKIHLRGFAYCFTIALTLLLSATEAKAQFKDTVTYDYGTYSSSCYICASGYNCFTSTQHLLIGNRPMRLSGLTVKVFHTSCGSGNYYAVLNGDTLGSFSRSYSCACSDCYVDSIEAGPSLLTSYLQTDTNDIWFGGIYLCTDKIMVIRTYSSIATNDAGVLSVDSPGRACPGSRTIAVSVGNFGRNIIDSVKVRWSWNGVAQNTYNYIGTLDTFGGSGSNKVRLSLGSKTLLSGKTDTLKVWTALPNGASDTSNYNDTIISYIKPSISDTITVGGSNPDYASVQAAINDLQAYGVCSPVVVSIRPGTYNEQLKIGAIPGSDSLKHVTFQSSTGDSSDVAIAFSASSSSLNHTLLIENASHVRFSQLTFEANGTSYACVVDFKTAFRNISFSNCAFSGYASSGSSTNQALIFNSVNTGNSIGLYFTSCDFREGSYAVYFTNSGSASGFRFRNNRMAGQIYSNIYLNYINNVEISNNDISRLNTSYTYGYGIYMYDNSFVKITGNHIITPYGGYGIYTDYMYGSSSNRNLIANNFISTGSANYSDAWGWYAYYNTYTDFYNNNVYANTLYTGYGNININRGTDIRIRNNSLNMAAPGYLIYHSYSGSNSITQCNNNNFYGNQTQFYHNSAISSLSGWKQSTGFDSASTFSNPNYTSSSDLHVYSVDLSGKAIPDTRISNDIDKQTRSSSTPDIGADEFDLVQTDAGIDAIQAFVADSVCLFVNLKNHGEDTLTSVQLNWSINGYAKTGLSWTGSLLSGKSSSVCIGTHRFSKDTVYTVRAWTSSPNGQTDTMNFNDTFVRTGKPALRGVYTIGGSSPDFTTFNAAITAMTNGGIIDSVLFKVRSGTYNERIVIPAISGANRANAIAFESVSKDSSTVTLSYATNWSEYEVVHINGASWVSFRHMTIKNTASSSPMRVFAINNSASNISLSNCNIEAVSYTSTDTYYDPLIYLSNQETGLTLKNNRFVNGSTALYADNHKRLTIQNNVFENAYYMGLYIYQATDLVMENNSISSNSAYSSYYSSYIYYIYGKNKISRNRISGPNKSEYAGLYMYSIQANAAGDSTYIFNNSISVGGNNAQFVVYIYEAENTYFCNNNLHYYGTYTSGHWALRMRYLYNCKVLNNNFTNNGSGSSGLAAEMYSLSNSEEDHNNYTGTGSNLTYINYNYYASLANMKSNGLDSNSLSISPGYFSNTDLHVQTTALNAKGRKLHFVKTDIDGENRDSISPDIGSDEFKPKQRDAGVVAFINPLNIINADTTQIKVAVSNFGLDTLFSFKIRCVINRDTLSSITVNDTLLTGDSIQVVIGNYIFKRDSVNNLSAWTYEPNNGSDQKNSNDTFRIKNKKTAMSGVYTIGGSSPDFPSFKAASNAMYNAGISGWVKFRVRSGTYIEQLRFTPIPGAGSRNSVVFESENLDSTSVTLRYNATYYDSNYVVFFRGASGITFRSMTITALNGNYGHVFQLEEGSSNLTLSNNIINGVNTSSTSTNMAVISSLNSSNADEYNEFTNNVIENGSYGCYLYGYGLPQYSERGLKVVNNTFSNQYYMGLNMQYQSRPLIHKNTFSSSSSYTSWYGIYAYYVYEKSFITGNTINRKNNGLYGMYLYDLNGNGDTALVANNSINIGGSSNSYGIYSNYTYYVHMVNNTIRVDGTSGTSAAGYYLNYGANNHFLNNNIVNAGPGYAVNISNPSSLLRSDYNNLKTNGSFLALWNSTTYANLSALRAVSNKDSNSISVDPLFYAADNLHIKNIDLNGSAMKHPLVKTDIDGDMRDTLNPDIGADEFTPPLLDAGVFEIINPKTPFQPDTQYIRVAIKNHGQNTISSLDIGWIFNDTVQSTYNWTGSLGSNDTTHVLLGLKYFDPDSAYSVVAWTSLPNNYNDTINDNDTARALDLYPALSGPYTIGGASPDFNTFTDAVNALKRGGIIGQVTFNVRNGTYNEKLLIPAIVGAGGRNSIIFQSENRDSSKVTLVNNTNTSVSNYTVRLSGASGITFRDLTISTANTTYGRVFELILGASNITLNNNILESANLNTTSTNHSIVYIYNGNHTNNSNNQFLRNVFKRGAMGIYNYGYRNNGVYDKNLLIEGNNFDQPYYMGIYLTYCDTVSIHRNTIRTGAYTNAFGIYMEYCRGNANIQRNNIHIPAGYMGIYMYNQFASAAKRSLVANNMISVLGNSSSYGIYFYGSYLDFYNNNIHLNSSTGSSYGAYFTSSNNVRSVNNIYNHSGAGYAMYTNSSSALTVSDNNCYRSAGSNLVYWNGNRSNLAALQSANAKDASSISIDPSYISNSDLHVRAIALDKAGMVLSVIKTDFDGRSRDSLDPDIGADEFDIPSPDDAGISAYIGPFAPFAAGSTPVNVVLTNHGSDTLTSATIHWQMNNVTQTAYSWTGSLNSGTSDTVSIGNFNFSSGILYSLKSWPSAPNGVSDTLYYNDTLKKDKIVSALEGIYTIGGSVPDFASFAEARDALMLGGVVDTVVFKVRNGTYNEQVQLLAYPGSAANRPVTFTSESGDSSKVTLQYNGNYNYVFSLKGADYVTISHMTLRNHYYYGGSVVSIDDASNNITIKNNRLLVDNTYYYYYYSGACILSASDRNDNTRIIGNAIEGGYYGIQMYGGGSGQHETGTVIENNRITNSIASGIYLTSQNAALIRKNQISFGSSSGTYLLFLSDVSNDVQITHNKLSSTYPYSYGIYISSMQGTSTKKALIANNFVSLIDPYYQGIYINSSNYVNLYYNSINLYGSNTNSASACLNLSGASNTDIRNNILSNLAGSYAFNSNAIPTTSNYNDLYSSGSNLCRINSTNYSNLAAWRSATSRDGNSKTVNPTFFSNTDLHTTLISLDSAATPISGITDDIDGNTRNTSKPDIGADEFNSLPNNLSVIAITNPVSACETDSQQLRISIFNYGSNTQKNFPVRYRVNGGSMVSETFTDSILPGTGKAFNFSGKVNTAAYGDYSFVVWTDVSSEQYRLNDTLKRKISNYQTPDSVGTMVPADSITNVAFPFSLSWAPASGATLYDIYIWADSINTRPGTPAYANQTQISRQITGGLGYGVKYKWQVVAKNPSCSTDGPVQRFTIKHLPDLRITAITPPTSAFSGNNISVSWTIRNSGKGTTGSSSWYDMLYLSKDKILDGSDLQLAGISNLSSLNSNQSYNNSTSVLIPNGTTGKNYILIYTDRYSNTLETNEGNNISSDSLGINVSLTPPPDLRVTSITKPSIANSGQTIYITYTVKNNGSGGTIVNSWKDNVYLNNDSSAGGTLMKTIQRTGALAVDSAYRVSTSFKLPNNISGGHYIVVKTDALNNVYEHASESNNEGISDSIRVILAPPADLIVRNLTAPDSVSNRQVAQIKYQLINQGGSQTTSAWTDQLYISKFNVFSTGSSTLLANIYLNNLASGDTFFVNRNVMIPTDLNGEHYLFLLADGANNLFEGSNDTNNTSAPLKTTIVSPDLRIKSVAVPASDTSGKTVNIQYKVMNAGPGDQIYSSRIDKIYLSRHSAFHPDSVVLVASSSYGAAIPAGDSIARSVQFRIPDGTIGNRYAFVHADETNNIFENGKDTNNTGRSGVMLVYLAPYPDLVPEQISTVDSTEAGAVVQLSYSVKNNGLTFCPQGWLDKIYLSKDSVFNVSKATLLRSTSINPGLKKDSIYSASHQIALSNKISAGNYYFYIFTDADNKRYEYVYENNNIMRSGKTFIDGYPPVDLEITSVSGPDTIYSGAPASFTWTVKNAGQANTIANSWFDRVYLSSDSVLSSGDLSLGQVQRLQNLNQNASYTANLNTTIPNGFSGSYYLIVRADYRDDNADVDTMNNIEILRNSGGSAKVMTGILSKSSDLQIVYWDFPSSAVSGQPARFIWKVENKGDTATKAGWWNDRFYLSTDYTIDNSDPIVGTISRSGNLARKGTYLDTANLFIPSHLSGNYIVIVKTDEANREYEHNAENNNTRASVLTVTLAPPGDLVVSSVSAPDSVTIGKPVTVNYQIRNRGSNPVSGSRTDNLYLSADSIFDGDDILIGSRTENASIVSNASRNMSISGNVNGITPGAYYFIVYADIKDNINESIDTNNTGKYGSVNAGIPELPLQVLTPDVLLNNSDLYYRLSIPEELDGESVIVTLKGDSVNGRNELYLKYGDVPTRNEFDYAFSTPFYGNQEIIVPSVTAGDYYILAYGLKSGGSSQNITLLARKLDFAIRKISPGNGGNTGTVTIKIDGSKFDSTTLFLLQLDSAYGVETPPLYHVHANDSFVLIDPTQAFATFNLNGKILGRYHMVAVKNGDSAKLRRSFVVEPGIAPDIQLNVLRPGNTRANATVSMEINFSNAGNTDMVNAELELISTAGAPISFTQDGLKDNLTTLRIKLEEVGAPPGILRPRGSGTVIIYTTSSAALGYNIILPEFN